MSFVLRSFHTAFVLLVRALYMLVSSAEGTDAVHLPKKGSNSTLSQY